MPERKVRIIGCGNPLMGNDGVGLAVIERLRLDHPDLDCVEGGLGGLGLLPLMEGYDRVVIVDATTGYGSIGDVVVFHTLPDSRFFPMSLHDIGIVETVAVARELGYAGDVVIIGIEGGAIDTFSDTLDPAVAAAIPRACRLVLSEVQKE
ncbi:MAG: hydrogenase maturation protease [Methanomicrobiales archaeon]|nr:hydrogenase maturation protease [Methanomicrobiales archaeon]